MSEMLDGIIINSAHVTVSLCFARGLACTYIILLLELLLNLYLCLADFLCRRSVRTMRLQRRSFLSPMVLVDANGNTGGYHSSAIHIAYSTMRPTGTVRHKAVASYALPYEQNLGDKNEQQHCHANDKDDSGEHKGLRRWPFLGEEEQRYPKKQCLEDANHSHCNVLALGEVRCDLTSFVCFHNGKDQRGAVDNKQCYAVRQPVRIVATPDGLHLSSIPVVPERPALPIKWRQCCPERQNQHVDEKQHEEWQNDIHGRDSDPREST